ncbi:hypothetical protein QP164_14390 [Sphingomonas sp. LR59]|uniref:hypothetical protein n=1 Tax=Sphingomonas sp. LR59 TaxID=3050232 RepID=UPI002FDFD3DA
MSFAKGQDLLRLAMMATRRRGVSLMEIEEEFACSERTAQRMTDALQAAFPQTERRVDEDRRARWLIPARAIAPLLTPSADELVALAEAIAQLDMAGLRKEAAHARGLERKVRALIPRSRGRGWTSIRRRFSKRSAMRRVPVRGPPRMKGWSRRSTRR